jgi:hypothetical protein
MKDEVWSGNELSARRQKAGGRRQKAEGKRI